MPMTHEFLSLLLGVRRAGVTVAAGKLQSSGRIRYHRGQLTILDRGGLERDACECYHVDPARSSIGSRPQPSPDPPNNQPICTIANRISLE
jgi:Crp-like helix-turn-helix domain